MPVSRKRMRPWLEDMIESRTISGLKWVDKDQKMFSIPWKHAARHGWEMDKDACLFKQWAIHTGKYKEGVSKADPKTWKANFRCAMNSLPDIEEVKDQSVNKGCGAVRVYRMLQAVSKKRDKKSSTRDSRHRSRGSKSKLSTDDEDYEEASTSPDEDSMQENTVDSTQSQSEADLSPSSSKDDEEVSMDWNGSAFISPDSTNGFYHNFQVSPLRPEFDVDEATIIAMAQQLEQDQLQWQQNVNDKDLLNNEAVPVNTFSSPESQWSDTSGEELELRFYTELTGGRMDLVNYLDPWPAPSHLSPIPCPL